MKIVLSILFLLLLPLIGFAQDSDSIQLHNKGFLRLQFMIPGLDYEKPITKNITIKAGVFSSVGYGSNTGWDLTPYIVTEQRYYLTTRSNRDQIKRERYFPGFYFSLMEVFDFRLKGMLIGPAFGGQLTIGRRWFLNMSTGIGYAIPGNEIIPLGLGSMGVGFIID